ncbi:LOW QUALITY PROTEIN: hypothetical protein M514_19596, partial [Trichuris suis]
MIPRINAITEDIEDTLWSWLRQSEFSLQVDESTLPGNEAVLLANYVISAVNKIKSNPLNDRLFRQLCDENNEEFNALLLHTEISFGNLCVRILCFKILFRAFVIDCGGSRLIQKNEVPVFINKIRE